MSSVWAGVSTFEDIATAGSGALNAAYFARRAWLARGGRRFAAALLAALFAGTALASMHLGDGPGAAEVLSRAPLLLANLTASALLWAGAGR